MITLYKIKNNVNGREYIGITKLPLKTRFRGHKNLKRQAVSYLRDDIALYGAGAFSIEPLVVCPNLDYAHNLEIAAIEKFKTHFTKGGYNVAKGGAGGHGQIMSKEAREKISKYQIGKKHSREVVDAHIKLHKGSKRSDETKKKMSISLQKRWSNISKEERIKYMVNLRSKIRKTNSLNLSS